jgi:AmmeMemoRadiSam system protein B/AmmeMemoRadiSam system protein A
MTHVVRIILLGVIIMVQNCGAKQYRQSPHAGSWYPGTESELRELITSYLEKARSPIHGDIVGLISPHAGYVYSGQTAAFAYKTVEGKEYDVIIVIGPSHRHGFLGVSVDTLSGRLTPLGKIPFDLHVAETLIKSHQLIIHEPRAHIDEHSVEIQIPFLQVALKKCKLVEIVMGTQDYETCRILSDAIVNATKNINALIVASSDLSHFHAQKKAEELDKRVLEAVSMFDPKILFERLSSDSCEACGGGPIITVMLAAQKMQATVAKPLIYTTSASTSVDYSQVVGYLAAVLYRGSEGEVGIDLGFTENEKKILKDIAWQSIEAAVKDKKGSPPKNITDRLREKYGIFVTIQKHGTLRGCIGYIIAEQPLFELCQYAAKSAALHDPRFPPVSEKELPHLEIDISILTPLERITNWDEISVGRDGLYIIKGPYRGLLLPQVAAEYGWTVEEFLEETCHKAGLPADAYKSPDTEVYKFSAEVF